MVYENYRISEKACKPHPEKKVSKKKLCCRQRASYEGKNILTPGENNKALTEMAEAVVIGAETQEQDVHSAALESNVSVTNCEGEVISVHDTRNCEEVDNAAGVTHLVKAEAHNVCVKMSSEEEDKKENKKKRKKRRTKKKTKIAVESSTCICEHPLSEQLLSQLDILMLNEATGISEATGIEDAVPLQVLNPIANVHSKCAECQSEESKSKSCMQCLALSGKKTKKSKKSSKKTMPPQPTTVSQTEPANQTPKTASDRKKAKTPKKATPKKEVAFDNYILPSLVSAGLAAKTLIKAPIRINQKNYKEAYVTAPDKGQDILIEGMKNRNRGLEGDIVVVQLNPEKDWREMDTRKQRTAIVVYISEKVHPRVGVGLLKPMPDKNKQFALFSPRDSRVPRMKIPMEKCPENFLEEADKYKNTLFLARITTWTEVNYAIGDIVEEIGTLGDIKSETVALLLENDIEIVPYDVQLYEYFPRSPYIIPEEELKYRADLRNECIFTIDPLTARDLDDAVSCKELDNGNFLVGVHISDVSFFLHQGTPLDLAVSKRATSVYLVENVYHMLPREMCLMCSLLPGDDKLAFSVFWEMTPDAEVVSHYFTRSVINSCVQLAYEHAQVMLENPEKEWSTDELPVIKGNFTPKDLSKVVNQLHKFALTMRKKRFKDGALRIDQPKVMFTLETNTGLPLDYSLYVNKECHRLIEEFMLLANMTVAQRLKSDYPKLAFLRCHPPPHDYCMTELQKAMEQRGIFLDVKSAGSLQESMWRYAGDDYVSKARMLVLNTLCAKPMARAKYFCSNFYTGEEDYWHYALNVPLYTHFTSPIRRYADIIVHRLLSGSLGYSAKPDWDPDYVHLTATNCNKQKYLAKKAGEQSCELYLSVYIGLHSPMVEEAVVMDVKNMSFDVIICNTGLVQRVYTNNLPAKVTCIVEDKKVQAQHIEWNKTVEIPCVTLQVVEIFSIVTVELSRSPATHKVEAKLLRPPGSGAFMP